MATVHAEGVMQQVGKENRQRSRSANGGKPSRIPRPKQRAPLSVVQAKPTGSSSEQLPLDKGSACRVTTSSHRPPSAVKAVPNFTKIHRKWEGKMQKRKKESRTPTVVKAFALTPGHKFKSHRKDELEVTAIPATDREISVKTDREAGTATPAQMILPERKEVEVQVVVKPEKGTSLHVGNGEATSKSEEFVPDPQSLQSILRGEPTVMVNRRATELGTSRLRDHYDFDSLLRLSVYHRRKPPPITAVSSHSKANAVTNRIQELYEQRLKASLARSRVRPGKQRLGTEELSDVKLNLDSEFTRVAEPNTPHMQTAPASAVPPLQQSSVTTPVQKSSPTCSLSRPLHLTTLHSQGPFIPTTTPKVLTPVSLPQHDSELHPVTHKTTPIHVITPLRATSNHGTVPMTLGARTLLHEPMNVLKGRYTFYEEDSELCAILKRGRPLPTADRLECRDPVAQLLDSMEWSGSAADGPLNERPLVGVTFNPHAYFVPISGK